MKEALKFPRILQGLYDSVMMLSTPGRRAGSDCRSGRLSLVARLSREVDGAVLGLGGQFLCLVDDLFGGSLRSVNRVNHLRGDLADHMTRLLRGLVQSVFALL